MRLRMGKIRRVLVNELYVGTLIHNRTTQKLKIPTRRDPPGDWVRTPAAFDSLGDVRPGWVIQAHRGVSRRGLSQRPGVGVKAVSLGEALARRARGVARELERLTSLTQSRSGYSDDSRREDWEARRE